MLRFPSLLLLNGRFSKFTKVTHKRELISPFYALGMLRLPSLLPLNGKISKFIKVTHKRELISFFFYFFFAP